MPGLPEETALEMRNINRRFALIALRDATGELISYMRKTIPGQLEITGTDIGAEGLRVRLEKVEKILLKLEEYDELREGTA